MRSLQDLQLRKEIIVTENDIDKIINCEECIKGKFNRLNLKVRDGYKVDCLLGQVHSDLCQLPSTSREGYKHVMSFIDEYSHYSTIYFLKLKSSALESFKKYVSMSEKETGEKLKCIRSDNGGEYTSQSWIYFCEMKGINHSMGPAHSPQLNGVAERFNQTLLDRVLPNLFKARLPVRFWSDAARHAIQPINLSPSKSIPQGTCPKEMWRRRCRGVAKSRTQD